MIKFKSTYKPLLFTTTMRNPERLKNFLSVLKNFNGKILTDEAVKEVVRELIKSGLYQTTYERKNKAFTSKLKQGIELFDQEVEDIIANSPQDHKEAGFKKGWPSRFDTWYKLAKELGFVYYQPDEKIMFSEVGLKLVDNEHPEFEQQVFLNAFVKYQRNNPFRRILNENVPLLLLLQVIKKINMDPAYNGNGITRKEIPLVLCWRDNDSEALYLKIKEIRENHGYEPSDEVMLEICDELTFGRQRSHKDETIIKEYPDDFIRKMKLTGLITIRGFGRFIDINHNESEKINYVIKEYSQYKKYKSEKEYFDYMSSIDKNLISIGVTRKLSIEKEVEMLTRWVNHYQWENIKKEMIKLAENKTSKDDVLKLIPGPMRLEFLTAVAIIAKHPKIKVKPNYISDDEGLPSSHAPGNKADVECDELGNYILVEVTLLTGAQQNIREMPPIVRHLKDKRETNENSISFFVSPRVHEDSVLFADFVKSRDDLNIITMSIKELLVNLEDRQVLYSIAGYEPVAKKDLLFFKDLISDEDIEDELKYTEYLPVQSLQAVASGFGKEEKVEILGWKRIKNRRLNKDMFIAQVVGKSMEPTIPDGSFCIFRLERGGSRNGLIVLVESHLVLDPETNQSFTIKRYRSEKEMLNDRTWRHKKIILSPDNKQFKDIVLKNVLGDDFRVVAEFIAIIA